MPASKSKPTKRVIKQALHRTNNWTPQQAAEWSDIRYRTLLRMLKEGLVPSIRIGTEQQQDMGQGKRRRRACAKYLIPRTAFIRWFESIGAPDPDITKRNVA